jgi:hypothetical protein
VKGQATVIAMRMQRVMPPSVTLSDFRLPAHLLRFWPTATAHAQVEVEPDDRPATLDLRWLVGIPLVWVEAFDADRLAGLCAAATAAGAKRVIGVHLQPGRPELQVAAMTDTEGAATWPN